MAELQKPHSTLWAKTKKETTTENGTAPRISTRDGSARPPFGVHRQRLGRRLVRVEMTAATRAGPGHRVVEKRTYGVASASGQGKGKVASSSGKLS
jgi:hypothetical protein